MEKIAIIITRQDYNNALKRIEDLISKYAQEETAIYKELDLPGLQLSK